MFDEILKTLENVNEHKLSEALTVKQMNQMRAELATPEVRPCDFDVTFEAWIMRLELWGQVTYYHKDPEHSWGKKKITKSEFLKKVTDDRLNKMFGIWDTKRKGLTTCILMRDYLAPNGKHYKEQFVIDVKLRKELR
jgi:hypothetical protein